MKDALAKAIDRASDFLFRRRSVGAWLVRSGLALAAISWGTSWVISVSIQDTPSPIEFEILGRELSAAVLESIAIAVGLVLIVVGAALEVHRYFAEHRQTEKKKLLVIEGRGLRDGPTLPLAEVIPSSVVGRREQLLLDIRQRVRDGVIDDPEAALRRIGGLPAEIQGRCDGFDRGDISIVYGGLLPVPFTFLVGVLVDDETQTQVYDWDRHQQCWRSLNEPDNGLRFNTAEIGEDVVSGDTVCLAVSTSYQVELAGVERLMPDLPLICLELAEISGDAHWSLDTQRELGRQFLEVVRKLSNDGVQSIHMFLACPSSVAFNLGRVYDKRNLPELVVYQYQRELDPPYPWGVRMPVSGCPEPQILRST